jgi:hypothetical protein
MKNWYVMSDPFSPIQKQTFTIFDISQLLLCVVFGIHCLSNLFVGRETLLIFVDESQRQGLSHRLFTN